MADEKQDEFEPGFRVVDKRQGASSDEGETTARGAAEEAAAGEAEPAREDEAGAPVEPREPAAAAAEEAPPELEAVDVGAVVQYCISILSGHAWQWMGLVANPVTKKVERDLEQARAAIDCADALFKQIEARLPETEARQLRSVLNDLRVNFVRQSSQGT